MKITETGPGSKIKEYTIVLNERAAVLSRTFSPDNDEPIAVRILPSGWMSYFHVIVEFGDYEQSDYHFLTAEQILEKYNIDLHEPVKQLMIDRELLADDITDEALGKKIKESLNLKK